MNPGSIVPVILGVSGAIGLLLALRSRQQGGQKKVEELYQHLQGLGVQVSVLEKGTNQEKVGQKRFGTQKPLGTIKLTDRKIDSINVHGVVSQYGVNYFIDYLVKLSSVVGGKKKKKTKLVKLKKTSASQGKLMDVEWRGDDSLARRLNWDYQLKDKLLQADISTIKGGIGIFPEPKHEYARIRTNYFLPTSELFDIIDVIAGHVKSEW